MKRLRWRGVSQRLRCRACGMLAAEHRLRHDAWASRSRATVVKIVLWGLLLLWVTTGGWAAAVVLQRRPADLTELSLEGLMNIEVTSVSKKTEKLSKAAAAIFVITQEDIRRSGVTSMAEALRLAPGIEVARVDAHPWAISAHGFNDVFANKLLVLLDGRSIYTPLFSGVFWDQQDTLREDIERIEVIRGPGATLWGANAVNGVINIITKRARDTQGGLLTAGGGTAASCRFPRIEW